MFSLRLATYLLVAPALAGAFVVALLSMDMVSARYIALAAAAGAVIGIPAALLISEKLAHLVKPRGS